MKKEDIILAVFKLVYGGDKEPTTEVERLENDGILGALDAASDLVWFDVRRVDEFASTKNCVLDLKEPEYSKDELMADCRELISTLNMTLRALIHKKNALYEIIEDLELEKIKADGPSPLHDFEVKIESSGEGRERIIADVAKAYAAEKDAGNDVFISVSGSFNPSNESDENRGYVFIGECCDSAEDFASLVKKLTPEGDDYYVLHATIYRKMEIPC